MITKEQRANDLAICEAATKGRWRWWTSNSHRRLRTDDGGDVAYGTKQRDGYDDIVISDTDMAASENAVNRLPAYIAEAEEMERRIAEVEAVRNRAKALRERLRGKDGEHTAMINLRAWDSALKILRGEP